MHSLIKRAWTRRDQRAAWLKKLPTVLCEPRPPTCRLRRRVAAAEQNADMQHFMRRAFRGGGTEGSA
jgi:hypothetical protein